MMDKGGSRDGERQGCVKILQTLFRKGFGRKVKEGVGWAAIEAKRVSRWGRRKGF